MEQKLTRRKENRLESFDYSSPATYFLTVCTKERQNYFWDIQSTSSFRQNPTNDGEAYPVGATIGRPPLSECGRIVDTAIQNIPKTYPAIWIEHYVVMPDHIHLLLTIRADAYGRPMVAPTMSRVVQQLKGYVTKQIGRPIWQKLFFDHIIRNRQDYEEHVKYILENSLRSQFKK